MSEDFIKTKGLSFLPHLLRRVSDQLVRGTELWDPEVGVVVPPRTVSTLYALDELGPLSVTEIAKILRQSHPLVITWTRQLLSLSLVEANSDPKDGRRTVWRITAKGKKEAKRTRRAGDIIVSALNALFEEADADVFEGLWRIEEALRETAFVDRLRKVFPREAL